MAQPERSTLKVSNVPESAIAQDLWTFLSSKLGPDSIFAIEIFTERKNWKSRGSGRVQFTTLETKSKAQSLSVQNNLVFNSHNLRFSEINDDIVVRPVHARNRAENGVLHVGFMLKEDRMCVLESWDGVKAWIMPERRRVEFWIWHEKECYKLEVMFEEILETTGFCLGHEKLNALLLKLKYAPRIYKKISGSNMASRFSSTRYRLCREDYDYLWVRTTEFSAMRSVGQSTSFCWEVEEDLLASNIFLSFPFYRETQKDIVLEDGEEFGTSSEIVPLIKFGLGSNLVYEVQYQLNSLVHMQKISLAAANDDLINFLSTLDVDTALNVLQRLHQLKFICYDPLSFLKTQLHVLKRNCKNLSLSSQKRLSNNVMNCYRVLVTPSRIYCLGPELETSNYVVKNFASYASDFMRVTFVEEDWSKLPAGAVTTSIQRGILSKPYRTEIYHRIMNILRDGIVIGAKRFEFLAFSASQLRSNSVWMFASSNNLKAEEIRQWMGCFEKIRSISKCAARMGQLFSSSTQTLVVPTQDVEIIPDIEVNSDGIDYCFSDGIGKISLSFARQVADKCGVNHIPSAFQIRYGGYKGVIAVDRNSFRKLSLRDSMLKFESKNKMLNVTKWSDSMPCYLNREIVTLLSTLGVQDESFEALQQEQLHLLGRMLTDKVVALNVLENLHGADSNNILVQMLNHGYEPNIEPYLSMMIQAHYWNLFSDLRSRCRIFVPKGRILLGCLDETGILNYGQVYACITLTKSELQDRNQKYFHKIDETKSILLGKVVVTKNPCLHPGDVRVLEAIFHVELEEKGLVDCLIFPQKGERPHTNECSGGDLDGDLYFISWDENLIPPRTEAPMDYTGRRPRIMDHDVTLEEIQKFFVDYMINDTLGAISTAHLVHADREPKKALSSKCLELAALHSMAVDFAKTGAPAEMPRVLKPREFPDFMERFDKPMYISNNVLGKLYRAAVKSIEQERSRLVWSEEAARAVYDHDLEVDGFEAFLEMAESYKDLYIEKMSILMNYYGAEYEDEILMGDLRSRASYLQRDNRKYGDMKDRILLSMKNLRKEVKEWFENSCAPHEHKMMASAWYHVTYHPSYFKEDMFYFSFPWTVSDVLLNIKAMNSKRHQA
ncbi:RNA-dependent RNA polymerase 2 [Benincasa hispida]|uniref:RNA-dependent RNA polymerase 2 n=1 Tax=Benincasa hispida TaxID=102211 RepID=UPI0019011898|nr:RNA-dependent RNA polymerase 2 [Benincasa hispida]